MNPIEKTLNPEENIGKRAEEMWNCAEKMRKQAEECGIKHKKTGKKL